MKILSVETSCDETAVAVVENGRNVLSSVISSQVDLHKKYGGVVPEIASRSHIETIYGITQKALDDADLKFNDLDSIAVTNTPGLVGALLVGVNFAKGISYATGLPLIPVHHLRSHIAANYITYPNLKPPFLCLVVSGGHSHIINVKGYTNMQILGLTRDDAAGESFDKAARVMGLEYPGGVNLDKYARNGDEKAFDFPRPKVSNSKYDFSFSGLKTALINKVNNLNQKNIKLDIENLSASFNRAIVDCLIANFIKSAEDLKIDKLAIAGGVSANHMLRKDLIDICKLKNYNLFMPDLNLCSDNAAMVGSQAYYEFKEGNVANLSLNAYATSDVSK